MEDRNDIKIFRKSQFSVFTRYFEKSCRYFHFDITSDRAWSSATVFPINQNCIFLRFRNLHFYLGHPVNIKRNCFGTFELNFTGRIVFMKSLMKCFAQNVNRKTCLQHWWHLIFHKSLPISYFTEKFNAKKYWIEAIGLQIFIFVLVSG